MLVTNLSRLARRAVLAAACAGLGGCGGGAVLQPDRAIFSLDANYQRFALPMAIEDAFDRTVAVFREAGYRLDVADRATGQISGRRGTAGANGSSSDKDLKIYALVIPRGDASELSIKIVQVINSGPLKTNKAELIVTDPMMYQFVFRRIENTQPAQPAVAVPFRPAAPAAAELPPSSR